MPGEARSVSERTGHGPSAGIAPEDNAVLPPEISRTVPTRVQFRLSRAGRSEFLSKTGANGVIQRGRAGSVLCETDVHNLSEIAGDIREDRARAAAPCSLVVCDRNPALAEGLARHLRSPTVRSRSARPDGGATVSLLVGLRPDLVVIDPMHLDLCESFDLSDFADAVRDALPQTRFMAYSSDITEALVRGLFAAGFRGVASKEAPLERLEAAVASVRHGGLFFDECCFSDLRSVTGGAAAGRPSPLSRRELEVLKLTALGLSAKEASCDLRISPKTVETYRARAMGKLGLRRRDDLVRFAVAQHWIPPG